MLLPKDTTLDQRLIAFDSQCWFFWPMGIMEVNPFDFVVWYVFLVKLFWVWLCYLFLGSRLLPDYRHVSPNRVWICQWICVGAFLLEYVGEYCLKDESSSVWAVDLKRAPGIVLDAGGNSCDVPVFLKKHHIHTNTHIHSITCLPGFHDRGSWFGLCSHQVKVIEDGFLNLCMDFLWLWLAKFPVWWILFV